MSKIVGKSLLLLGVFVFVVATVVGVQAATTDFTADGNITVSGVVHGAVTADLLIMNSSKAESWSFDSGVFSVTNPNVTAGFTVGSDNGVVVKSIRVKSQSQNSETVCADNITSGTSYVTLPTAADIYTVYPSDTSCEGTGMIGGGGGGGGGTKKSKTEPTSAPVTPTVPVVPASTPVVPLMPLSQIQTPVFTSPLLLGMEDEKVKLLQQLLNTLGYSVATEGPGSVGAETTYFGPATHAAVLKFQLENDIISSENDPGAGRVGPLTREKINTIQSLLTQLQQLQAQLKVLVPTQ